MTTSATTATLDPHSQEQVTKPAINDDSATKNKEDDRTKKKKKHKKRKASLGRLKKLWRRAAIATAASSPGITSRAEWLELMELHAEWKERQGKGSSGSGRSNSNDTESAMDENSSVNHKKSGSLDHDAMKGPLPGPSVNSKQNMTAVDLGNSENWQMTEGTDHRDIVLNLLFGSTDDSDDSDCGEEAEEGSGQQNKRKKRKLNNSNGRQQNSSHNDGNQCAYIDTTHASSHVPAMPSWATITNIAGVGGLAVIEIHIDDDGKDNDSCPLMPSQLIKNATQTKHSHDNNIDNSGNIWNSLLVADPNNAPVAKRTIGSACKVKLFQGDKHPRSLSDILMYLPQQQRPNQENTEKINEVDKNGLDRDDILFNAVQALKLTGKQLRSEGFPLIVQAGDEIDDVGGLKAIGIKTGRETISAMSSDQSVRIISGKDALKLVKDLAVKVEFGYECGRNINDEEDDEFLSSVRYVQTFRHGGDGMPSSTRKPKIYAMDCEMVKTAAGPELVRVSLIEYSRSGCDGDVGNEKQLIDNNEKSVVVLDELVKPRRPVLDYLSGRCNHSNVNFNPAVCDFPEKRNPTLFCFPSLVFF